MRPISHSPDTHHDPPLPAPPIGRGMDGTFVHLNRDTKLSALPDIVAGCSSAVQPEAIGCPLPIFHPLLGWHRDDSPPRANLSRSALVTRAFALCCINRNRSLIRTPENYVQFVNEVEPAVGIEPTTDGLQTQKRTFATLRKSFVNPREHWL